MSIPPFSLYLHIPFCIRKCPYCDFATEAVGKIPEDEYLGALITELDHWATTTDWSNRHIATIFLGGGTPSALSDSALARLLEHVQKIWHLLPNCEITLEANPESVTFERAQQWRELGITRVSIGVQSFTPKHLTQLGRTHQAEDGIKAVNALYKANIPGRSIDIMYGLPHQTLAELTEDLEIGCSLPLTHLSAYTLTVETGTPLATNVTRGIVTPLQDDLVAQQMEFLISRLSQAGLNQYEISNFARSDQESRHNLGYWEGRDYLGVGAGAHSFHRTDPGVRWANVRSWSTYVKEVTAQSTAVAWRDQLTRERAMEEFFLLRLRLNKGVDLNQFLTRFNRQVEDVFPEAIPKLTDLGLVTLAGRNLVVTNQGRMLLDSVTEYFVL